MNRRTLLATYVIAVGTAMLGLWSALLATGTVSELETAPYEIGYHLVAEVGTALALLGAGLGLLRHTSWATRLYPVALGMLLYTVINSAGYYAQWGDVAMVGLFTVLTAGTLLLLGAHVLGRRPEVSRRPLSGGEPDA